MTGEELLWFRVASHLGKSISEAQDSISSTEFMKWIEFLRWKDTEEFNRQDFYLAQIAAVIQAGQVKNPRSVTIKSMMLDFAKKKEKVNRKEPLEIAEERMDQSKNFWLASMGIKLDKE